MNLHDERGPSSLARIKACPGSYLKSKGKIRQTGNADASRGEMLHGIVVEVWRGNLDKYEGLPEHDQKAIDGCINVLHSYNNRPGVWFFEAPLALVDKSGSMITFGRPDAFRVCEDGTAILIDWKMGFCEVDQPIENWQLAAYAAMIMQAHAVDSVESIIVQPFHNYEPYTWTNCEAIINSIKHIYDASDLIDAPLLAGIHCKYCPSKGTCEVFDAWTAKAENTDPTTLDPADAVDYKAALDMRGKLIDSRKEQLKELARIYGGRFGNVGFRRQRGSLQINVKELFDAVKEAVPASEFLQLCTVRLGDTGSGETKSRGIKSMYSSWLKENGKVKTLKAGEEVFEELPGVSRGPDVEVFTVLKEVAE